MKTINEAQDYEFVHEIGQQATLNSSKYKQYYYKLQPSQENTKQPKSALFGQFEELKEESVKDKSQYSLENLVDSVNDKYFKLRVKRQQYAGRPAIAIIVSNRTSKVKNKLNKMLCMEDE